MNGQPPKLSVVMPVYNGELFLREAVESVLAQTYRDFEFIIIDDGSTDGSLDIIKEYGSIDSRIRMVSQPNHGLPATLNIGISIAKGKYIARMDADDVCFPDRFEKQMLFLDEHPEVAVLGAQAIHIDEKGNELKIQNRLPCEPLRLACRMVSLWCVYHPLVMFRKDIILSVGCYEDLDGLEDFDLWLRVSRAGWIANLKDVLLKYRFHNKNKTLSKGFSAPAEIYTNYSEELFDMPAEVARRVYERRPFFFVFPWVIRSADRIASRFNTSRFKVLICREFLDAWLILAWKQDPLTAGILVALKSFSLLSCTDH